jgi:glycerophosphoryl diester phosphodiesterase
MVRASHSAVVTAAARPRVGRVANVAHRGASGHAPENTLTAVRAATVRDCDLIEVDVQRSKDGALVLLHDTTLARTTNVRQVFPDRAPWLVGEFALAEIQTLDAGHWKSSDYSGERIPTLTEAVEVVSPGRVGLLLELKAVALYPGIVPEVVAALREIPGYLECATSSKRLIIQSFDHDAMRDLKELEPSVPVGLLGAPALAQLPTLATWADQINPGHWSVDAPYVSAAHDLGMECMVWTVNRVYGMKRALKLGVDGVITNHPDVLQRVLDSRM